MEAWLLEASLSWMQAQQPCAISARETDYERSCGTEGGRLCWGSCEGEGEADDSSGRMSVRRARMYMLNES